MLEQTLLDVPGVENVCVVGMPDARLGQAIVAAYVGTTSPHDIIAALDELPRWQLPKQLKRVPELPLIGPGKVDRLKVAEIFHAR